MLKTVARFALLRVLPRRILPVVTVVEILLFVRSVRKRSTVRVANPATGAAPAAGAAPPSDATAADPADPTDPA